MEFNNTDLINICRVCRNPNQDADFESLYMAPIAGFEMLPALTQSGLLYEELLGELSPETYEIYPRYICNSCDLQLKLFKKLKDKAIKTMKYLSQIAMDKQDQRLDSENGVIFLKDIGKDNESKSVNVLDYGGHNQSFSDLEQVLNPEEYNQQYPIQLGETRSDMELDCTDRQEQLLEDVGGKVEDTGQTSLLDAADSILEIYQQVEDESDENDIKKELLHEEEEEISNIDSLEGLRSEAVTETLFDPDENLYIEVGDYKLEIYNESLQSSRTRSGAQKPKLTTVGSKKDYKCTVCGVIFFNNKDFKHHSEFVHEQVYSCHICSRILKTSYSLATHMRIHDETPAFQCELCQKTFTQKCHYQYHMNKHNNIRNHMCKLCGKGFLVKTDLKVHMRLHNGERPYVCEICGKDYLLMEHLKSHALKHTDQKFPCDMCKQTFATPKTLRLHKRTIHTEEPKFKCQFCLKKFRRKHHLQYHVKKLHPSTDILAESLYDVIDEDDINVDDDLDENQDLIEEDGYISL